MNISNELWDIKCRVTMAVKEFDTLVGSMAALARANASDLDWGQGDDSEFEEMRLRTLSSLTHDVFKTMLHLDILTSAVVQLEVARWSEADDIDMDRTDHEVVQGICLKSRLDDCLENITRQLASDRLLACLDALKLMCANAATIHKDVVGDVALAHWEVFEDDEDDDDHWRRNFREDADGW